MAPDADPPNVDARARQLLLALRDGAPAEKALARRALATIFESRDLPAEAIELLLSNARDGYADAELYRSMARLYLRLGNEALAAKAALESVRYAEPAATHAEEGLGFPSAERSEPTPESDGEPAGAEPIVDEHLSGPPGARPDLRSWRDATSPAATPARTVRGLLMRCAGWVLVLALVIAALAVAMQAPLAAASYAVSAVAIGMLASGWQGGRRLLRVPDGPLGTGLLGFACALTFLLGGAILPRSDGPFVIPSTPTTVPATATPRLFATSTPAAPPQAILIATFTPVPTAPTQASVPVAEARPSVVGTASPEPVPVAASSASPGPSPAPEPPSENMVVANAGSEGVRLRATPGSGEALKVLYDGAAVTALGEERQEDGRTWRHVRDVAGAEGWVASDFLVAGTSLPASDAAIGENPRATPAATVRAGPGPTASGQAQPRGGACPASHPIKGNASSMIYHVPGGAFYAKTNPEACFASEADARAAGYRRSRT